MWISNKLLTWLAISFTLFLIGYSACITTKKTLINILMNIEVTLLGINLWYISVSSYLEDIMGELFVLVILTVSAAEVAIGLAILVMYFRRKGIISINLINYIKG